MIDVSHPVIIHFILNFMEVYLLEFVWIILVVFLVAKLPFWWFKDILVRNKTL